VTTIYDGNWIAFNAEGAETQRAQRKIEHSPMTIHGAHGPNPIRMVFVWSFAKAKVYLGARGASDS
jgi:hypothetical protein